jgi:hypothetical protein
VDEAILVKEVNACDCLDKKVKSFILGQLTLLVPIPDYEK